MALSRRQAIIWTNAEILLIRPSGINFNENLIEINTFSFKKISFQYVVGKVAAILSRPQCVNIMTGYKTIVHAVRQLQYGNLDHTLNFAGELLGGRCESGRLLPIITWPHSLRMLNFFSSRNKTCLYKIFHTVPGTKSTKSKFIITNVVSFPFTAHIYDQTLVKPFSVYFSPSTPIESLCGYTQFCMLCLFLSMRWAMPTL